MRRVCFSFLLSLSLVSCAQGGVDDDAGSTPEPDSSVRGACGDGVLEGVEECEGANLDGQSCTSLGYAGGELRCLPDCTFDKDVCTEGACGNGVVDEGEDCDGAELGFASCELEGFVGGGTLGCNPDCTFDTRDCSRCGDGAVDAGEECDGTNLGGATCVDRGFTGGTLACGAGCGFDESGCVDASCGDGARGGSEDCDGADLGGATCADVGFHDGALSCNGDCTFRVAECHNCGNGSVDGVEQCDGADLGGASCETRGFTRGTLGCNADCTFDEGACETAACGNGRLESGEACDDGNGASGDGCSASCAIETGWSCSGTPSSCVGNCGDGMIVGGESCDGSNLDGQSCTGRGFTGGALACDGSCNFDESGCTTTSCGDGTIDSGEECDDGNTVAFDGCDATCQVEAGFHLPVRLTGGDGSNHGRVEVLFSGTWRDVCDDTYAAAEQQAFADVVCRQLGFTGTGHQFLTSFGGGSNTPLMDDVQCTGSEPTLAQCPFDGWNRENCSGIEAVGVRCVPAEGDIRLVDGPHGMEGRLQVYHSGAWGEVCDDYFDGAYSAYYGYSTTTVCQQLGYRDGSFLTTYDAPTSTFVLDDVNCTGTERRIGDCPHQPWGNENCGSTEGAGFRCEVHGEGDLRLVDGTARNHGRVEVLHAGVWGTVCDDFISTSGPRQTGFISVACGQLGFSGAGSAPTSGFPDGVDPTWMDDLDCAGTEASLPMCTFRGWGVENCAHFEDIGLSCTP